MSLWNLLLDWSDLNYTLDVTEPTSKADWPQLAESFRSYLNGNSAVTAHLFKQLLKILQGYFRVRMNGSSGVDDMVQATLLKIQFARDRFDSKKSLKTWVFTIASRTLIDHWRGKSSEADVFDLNSATQDETISDFTASADLDPAMTVELTNDLSKALLILKPTERRSYTSME